jgi:hypothetical protein
MVITCSSSLLPMSLPLLQANPLRLPWHSPCLSFLSRFSFPLLPAAFYTPSSCPSTTVTTTRMTRMTTTMLSIPLCSFPSHPLLVPPTGRPDCCLVSVNRDQVGFTSRTSCNSASEHGNLVVALSVCSRNRPRFHLPLLFGRFSDVDRVPEKGAVVE